MSSSRTVAHVMTRDVVAVGPYAPYKDVARALAEHHISGVPVIDGEDRVLGVISEADLLAKEEYHGRARIRRFAVSRQGRRTRRKAIAGLAGALMTRPPITVGPHTSVVRAAKLMDREHVKRIPVVDEAGRLIGIVSRGDLLRVFLRPDDEIRREIVSAVFERSLWINAAAVVVSVKDGVVTLAGTLERRSFATLAVELARRVEGVVDIVDKLRFEFDDTRISQDAERYWRERIS